MLNECVFLLFSSPDQCSLTCIYDTNALLAVHDLGVKKLLS